MKIFSALFGAAFFLLPCYGEIVIVDKGKAFMPVIYADKADPVCKTLAEIFISAVRCGTGVTLKMIPESRFAGGKAIFIGPTRAAAAAGIITKSILSTDATSAWRAPTTSSFAK